MLCEQSTQRHNKYSKPCTSTPLILHQGATTLEIILIQDPTPPLWLTHPQSMWSAERSFGVRVRVNWLINLGGLPALANAAGLGLQVTDIPWQHKGGRQKAREPFVIWRKYFGSDRQTTAILLLWVVCVYVCIWVGGCVGGWVFWWLVPLNIGYMK